MQFVDLKTQYERLKKPIQQRIDDVFEHGQFVMGPEIYELERRLADFVGTRHCISVSSGSDALLITLMASGIRRGDEIITTPFSFIATAEMIALLGATPVFVDIDPQSYNIDPTLIEASITSRTKAIMPVSLYGQCAAFSEINAVAKTYGLSVIEDAAQSFGGTHRGVKSCALSTVGCTSFYPSKPLGCYGDGGACFTDDDELANRIREIRVHGQERPYHHRLIGVNGRMDTVQAAIILGKLDSFPDEVEARARIGARYSEQISANCPSVMVPHIEADNTSVYAQYTIQAENRDRVIERLQAGGIPTAVHYPVPLHRQPVFLGLGYTEAERALSVAESAAERVFSLPMHPYLDEETQDRIVDALTCAT